MASKYKSVLFSDFNPESVEAHNPVLKTSKDGKSDWVSVQYQYLDEKGDKSKLPSIEAPECRAFVTSKDDKFAISLVIPTDGPFHEWTKQFDDATLKSLGVIRSQFTKFIKKGVALEPCYRTIAYVSEENPDTEFLIYMKLSQYTKFWSFATGKEIPHVLVKKASLKIIPIITVSHIYVGPNKIYPQLYCNCITVLDLSVRSAEMPKTDQLSKYLASMSIEDIEIQRQKLADLERALLEQNDNAVKEIKSMKKKKNDDDEQEEEAPITISKGRGKLIKKPGPSNFSKSAIAAPDIEEDPPEDDE